jgi:dimethylargininase
MTNAVDVPPGSRLTRAVVRLPGENFGQGLTAARLGDPDHALMLVQHSAYVRALKNLGLDVLTLEPRPEFPDAHFVEDTAVVLSGLAVITRPGAPSRRGEEETIEPVLGRFLRTAHIRAPGTLDGGDVLVLGRRIFIGLSERTNAEGARQMGRLAEAEGYAWTAVPVVSGLHLKSSVNAAGEGTLLITRRLERHGCFRAYNLIEVDPAEEAAANVLCCNGSLIMAAGFDRTREKLEKRGLSPIVLDVSEARKMDGGLTCLSLRL